MKVYWYSINAVTTMVVTADSHFPLPYEVGRHHHHRRTVKYLLFRTKERTRQTTEEGEPGTAERTGEAR